jgi:iduronate 2-sulfatase
MKARVGKHRWQRWGYTATLALAICALSQPVLAKASAANSRPKASPTRQPQRMNVLFLIADDLNTRMSATGFRDVRTPNLDRLAARSVNFANAYSQYPWCGPSRASFLTGRRPDTTRVWDLKTMFRNTIPDAVTLPQYFRQNGYFTGRVGKIFHQGVPGDIGTSGPDDVPSWDRVVNPAGRDKINERDGRMTILNPHPSGRLGSALAFLADEGTDEEQTDGKVATETIAMLKQQKDKPFFIAAGFYRPHVPEVAPKKYFDMYPLARVRFQPEDDAQLAKVLPAAYGLVGFQNLKLTLEQQRSFVRAYYAATSFMDAQVGRVLDALKPLGLDRNTIIVFTSDHGFLLGEHGQWEKQMLFEKSVKVPLIVNMPGARGNRQVSRKMVELVDLYPTLAEMAGLPQPEGMEGRSLKPLLQNPRASTWTHPAFSQVQGGRSVRVDQWRYTEWDQGKLGAELYDEENDPAEHNNLARDPRYASVVVRLKALLPKSSPGPRYGSSAGE